MASALLPGACALCASTGTHILCGACRNHFFKPGLISKLRCQRCGLPTEDAVAEARLCGVCLRDPPSFDATIVTADYIAPIDQMVLELKFGARLALAPLFAELLRDALLAKAASGMPLPTCLAPVPLGRQRLQERGFNQALEIARPLASFLGVPLSTRMIERVRDTPAQAQLSPSVRRRNLRQAFTLTPRMISLVKNQHVGIVDDVMTTGATLNEVAQTLKRFGASRVTNLVFARTPPK